MYKIVLLFFSITILSASLNANEIFKKCASCHGEKGEKHSQNITKPIASFSEKELINILNDYKLKKRNEYGLGTIMQGQAKNLSKGDIDALAKYISAFPKPQEKKIREKINTPESAGKDIFHKCAICHGENGQKSSLSVSKIIAGMDKNELINILKEYQEGTRNVYGYGAMMRGQATKLTNKEMDEVATYVSSLSPKSTTKEPQKQKTLTKEKAEQNAFIKEWFDKNTDPNANFEDAKEAYEIYKNTKETNEENK